MKSNLNLTLHFSHSREMGKCLKFNSKSSIEFLSGLNCGENILNLFCKIIAMQDMNELSNKVFRGIMIQNKINSLCHHTLYLHFHT